MDTVHECDRRTDRQTDRITISKTVQRRASHGNNHIYGCQHCSGLDSKTRKRGLDEVPRTGVGLLGRGRRIPLPPARRSGEYANVSYPSKFPQWGPERSPGKFGVFSIFGPQKLRQNGLSDNALFDIAPKCHK